jgi:hypothetical protein
MTRAFMGYIVMLVLTVQVPSGRDVPKKLFDANEIDQKFSQVWKESEASRRLYTWKEKTEVTRDDKVVQVLVEEVSRDVAGKPIRKVISNEEAPLPSTFLIKQIAEEQKAKIVSFMRDLRVFLEQYSLTNDSTRHSFFSKALISPPDARGQLLVSGSDVLTKGDKLKWWIDTRSYTITYATISTSYKGVSADFSATYYLLPGLNYMSQAKIRVPSKNMVVSLKFYDFSKTIR